MSESVGIQVSEEALKSIEKKLEGIGKSEGSVLKTAVNNTAKQAQRLLAGKAAQVYTGKVSRKSAIMSRSSITKANTKNPTAVIKFKSPVHEIKEFHVSSLAISKTAYRKDGKRSSKKIKGNVLKGSPKPLDNAFVVQFKTGHVSVVSRVPGSKMRSNPKKEKLKKILSPADKAMIGSEKVYGASQKEIENLLYAQVNQVMDKVLGGG